MGADVGCRAVEVTRSGAVDVKAGVGRLIDECAGRLQAQVIDALTDEEWIIGGTASANRASAAVRCHVEVAVVVEQGEVDVSGLDARGCGVKNAIKLRTVSGIKLSQSSIMDCGTAKALKKWVEKGLKPSIGKRGGGVSTIKVAAHYACRTRNNQKGAKISEHGKGRAIDISGFILRNGETVTVLKGWRSSKNGKPLKRMHKAACGPFG